ncbi:MAG: YncE family protein [Acidobacteriota bacterium]
MSRRGLYALLMFIALLVAACAPAISTPSGGVTPAVSTTKPVATPEPIRPPTASPIPLGKHAIFVVDPRNGDPVSRILVIDADAQRVVSTLVARYTPEIVFSPDGRRLYLADSYASRVIRGDWHDVVSVYDARSGELLHDEVGIPKRLLYKGFPNAHPYMFLSRDGSRLFVGKYGDPDIHMLRVAVMDSATFQSLAEWVQPNCWTLLPLLDGQLLCAGGMQPSILDSMTGRVSQIPGALPAQGVVALSSSRDRLYVVANAAGVETSVTVVDLAATPPRVLDERVALQALQGFQIGYGQIVVSPDESRLYIGVITGKHSDSGSPDEIWAYETGTWTRAGILEPSDPAFQVAISADGTLLYTVNPFKKSLSIFDAASFREIGVMHDLGETPAQVVVPPSH